MATQNRPLPPKKTTLDEAIATDIAINIIAIQYLKFFLKKLSKNVATCLTLTVTSVSTIPVTVQSLKDIASNGNTTNPGGQVTNPNGGGAFDPLSLLMLGGLAAFMRRRKAQK